MHIDWWTLALQTLNILILIGILARFFFLPILDIVAKRQKAANAMLEDAAHARDEAAEMRDAAQRVRTELAAERQSLLAQARDAAQIEKQNLFAKSSQEIAKLRSEAEVAIVRERAAAGQAIIESAAQVSVDIARRLLERLPHRDFYGFLDEICREVRALSPETREGLASSAAADRPLEVVTATPLPGKEAEHIRGALKEAFGLDLPLAFRSDPSIIAGIEIHGRNAVIRDTWRADLDQIRKELSRDRDAPSS